MSNDENKAWPYGYVSLAQITAWMETMPADKRIPIIVWGKK